MRRIALLVILVLGPASAGEQILPVFAHRLPGHSGNLWSSEIYVTNFGVDTGSAHYYGFLPGFVATPTEPCQVFVPPLLSVEPGQTLLWRSSDIAFGLECSERFVGALIIETVGEIRLESRMVNHRGDVAPDDFLKGFGQSFEAFEVADLIPGEHLLPGLVWHPSPCGPAQFSSYIGFVNSGTEAVVVTVSADIPNFYLDGRLVDLPVQVEIAALSWKQVPIEPGPTPITGCLSPEIVDLRFLSDGPLAIYGSVVDRSMQDPRTVRSVPTQTIQAER